jgi:hypothetical protein
MNKHDMIKQCIKNGSAVDMIKGIDALVLEREKEDVLLVHGIGLMQPLIETV